MPAVASDLAPPSTLTRAPIALYQYGFWSVEEASPASELESEGPSSEGARAKDADGADGADDDDVGSVAKSMAPSAVAAGASAAATAVVPVASTRALEDADPLDPTQSSGFELRHKPSNVLPDLN